MTDKADELLGMMMNGTVEEKPLTEDEQKLIDFVNQGMTQEEIGGQFGVTKFAISRRIKALNAKHPELQIQTQGQARQQKEVSMKQEQTEQAAIVTQDTPQTTQKPQTAPEPPQAEIPTPKEEKTAEKANTKAEKQTFSFRAEQSKIENWKLYAETIGTKDIGTLWTAAIDEYISNHELTADQQAVYDLKKKAAEIQRNQK